MSGEDEELLRRGAVLPSGPNYNNVFIFSAFVNALKSLKGTAAKQETQRVRLLLHKGEKLEKYIHKCSPVVL